MKRIAIIAFLILLTASCAAFFACGDKESGGELPQFANDKAVVAIWDDYTALNGIPRYQMNGIFNGIQVDDEGTTVISLAAVSDEDFTAYTEQLMAEGFRLADGSSIWNIEGMSAAPVFIRGKKTVTLLWYINGALMINVD